MLSIKYLIVPDTKKKLVDGDIVMLSKYPSIKWILHYGWYLYCNHRHSGWYFSAVLSNDILPVTEENLNCITVISTNSHNVESSYPCSCHCNPNHTPSIPNPDFPSGSGLTEEQADELNRSWISVDTISDRDQLSVHDLPDGKVVRVNITEDGSKYFIWNREKSVWDDVDFGSNAEGCVKTVNGIEPDENGNIDLDFPSTEETLVMIAESNIIDLVTDVNGDIFTDLNGNIIVF